MALAELLQTADLAFQQIKKVSSATEDVNAIFGTLNQWAGQIGDINREIDQSKLKNLHEKSCSKSKPNANSTEQAMEIYMARVKVQEMERDLYQMFLYGRLRHLGQDGYREFASIRQRIEQQKKQEAEQNHAWELAQEADQDFLKQLKILGGAAFASIIAVVELAERVKALFE